MAQATIVPSESHPRLFWATWVGIGIWFLGLVGLLLLWLDDPGQATACALAVATFYYAGQFGAMPLGLAAGGEPLLIGLYVWAADAAGLLVFFPLTQLGVDRVAQRNGFLGRWVRGLQNRAQRRQGLVRRYGPMALFAFTSLPFLFNSPILGATIGRIAGLRIRSTLTALLSAVTLMSAVWTFLFYHGLEQARRVDERLPWALGLASVGLTLILAACATLARAWRRHGTAGVPEPAQQREP